jgi:Predicted hydrolases or acyltransferases (alpha/beta hydrolase superfamily)
MERTVRPDGRTLAVEDAGDPTGRPVLVHLGTPDSRHLYGPWVADAAGRGLRLICYDRPGYGGSPPQPGRSIADCAGDVRAICAALEIDRLAMWGWSGGGAHVLACAALLPDLVAAAASLASLAPYGAEGLDYFAGMGQDDVDYNRLLLTDPQAAARPGRQGPGRAPGCVGQRCGPSVRVHVGARRCGHPAGRGRDGRMAGTCHP